MGKWNDVRGERKKEKKTDLEITRYERNITDTDREIRAIWEELGRNYYEKYKDTAVSEEIFGDFIKDISELEKIKRIYYKLRLKQEGKMLCDFCETINPLGSSFCNGCGEKLGQQEISEEDLPGKGRFVCPNCGAVLSRTSSFCAFCGLKNGGRE